jgi:hypothetical protein
VRILDVMSVATLVAANPSSISRLLADVAEVDGREPNGRGPVVDRLAVALGRDFAERLVAELSTEALGRLDAGLTPAFVDRLASLASEAA